MCHGQYSVGFVALAQAEGVVGGGGEVEAVRALGAVRGLLPDVGVHRYPSQVLGETANEVATLLGRERALLHTVEYGAVSMQLGFSVKEFAAVIGVEEDCVQLWDRS